VHPWKTYKDEFGAEVPEQISFCHFHAKFCLDPRKAHGDHLVKIKEPNEFALCNECYVVQKKRPPPSLAKFRIPGVTRAARAGGGGGGGIKASKDPSGDALNEDTVCDWKPNRMLIEERGLSCHNKVRRSPAQLESLRPPALTPPPPPPRSSATPKTRRCAASAAGTWWSAP
jgi:hypothetical protein